MRVPAVRERVNIEGRRGAFLVAAVDRDRQVADLISTLEDGVMEEDVPFTAILLLPTSRPRSQGD